MKKITVLIADDHAIVHSESKTAAARELSSRQKEVVQLIAEGYSSKEMALLLFMTTETVEKHRQTLMRKLDIHNIAALTRYAVSSGIVESNQVPGCVLDAGPGPARLTAA
jgi:DNA-binding CsgD family transcriptional regulator